MVKSYRDLEVWKKSYDLSKIIYEITKVFPENEKFGLISQLRRCSISIPSNIAEGSSRRSTVEFIRFINISSGSLAELETQIMLSTDFGYIESKKSSEVLNICTTISIMLFKLQQSLKRKT